MVTNLLRLILVLVVYAFVGSTIEWVIRGSAGDPSRDFATYMGEATYAAILFPLLMVPAGIPYLLLLGYVARGRPSRSQRLIAFCLSPISGLLLWFSFLNFFDTLLSTVVLVLPVVLFAALVGLPPPADA
jgi:hypothetical protein